MVSHRWKILGALISAVMVFGGVGSYVALHWQTEMTKTTQETTSESTQALPTNPLPPTQTVLENTRRSGVVSTDERWRGVIIVTGDIMIRNSATLTIEPGTTVRFGARSDDQHSGGDTPITDPYFPNDPALAPSQISGIVVITGSLYAVGSAEKPIIFTSDASNPAKADWQSIAFEKGRLSLTNSIVEYAYYGMQINQDADDINVVIKNNTVRHIQGCGICLSPRPTVRITITISGNDISDCGHEGIDTHSGANVVIEHNILHGNLNGIVIDGNNSTIRYNRFVRNEDGIAIISRNSFPSIYENSFEENQVNVSRP